MSSTGFSGEDVIPWLPVNPAGIEEVNVANQEDDQLSPLNVYRTLASLRRRRDPTVLLGRTDFVDDPDGQDGGSLLCFTRRTEASGRAYLVGVNLSKEGCRRLPIIQGLPSKGKVIARSSSRSDLSQTSSLVSEVVLEAEEGIVIRFDGDQG